VKELQADIALLGKAQNQLASDLQSNVATLADHSQRIYDRILNLRVLKVLCPDKKDERFVEVSTAHRKTFNWILESDNNCSAKFPGRIPLHRWLAFGSGVFHITGKIGSGKSTLMKFLWVNDRTQSFLRQWAGGKELICAKFFFWRHGNKFQRSINGLYRSILHDILSSHPELLPVALSALLAASGEGGSLHNLKSNVDVDTAAVRNAVQSIFRLEHDASLNKYRFCIFIDGLDEFEETEIMDYKDLVEDLEEWVKTSSNVKIILSSREYNRFLQSFNKVQRIRLQDLTKDDISIYVSDRLRDSESLRPEDIQELLNMIVQKADGVFLWVSLVVKLLRKGIEDRLRLPALRNRVSSVPKKLKDLFAHLLDQIDEGDRNKAYSVFAVAISIQKQIDAYPSSSRRFYLLEFVFLEEALDDPGFLARLPPSCSPMDEAEYARQTGAAARRLNGLCQSLLEVIHTPTLDYVAFTHRSVYEFLSESHSKTVKIYTKNFPLRSIVWKVYFASIATQPAVKPAKETIQRLTLAINLSLAIQNIMTDNSIDIQEQFRRMDWLDTLIWTVQKQDASCLQEAEAKVALWISDFTPGMEPIHDLGGVCIEKDFWSYRVFSVTSVTHLAAALGWEDYIVHKMSVNDISSTELERFRLYRAIQVALVFGNSKAISLLGRLLQWLSPNEVVKMTQCQSSRNHEYSTFETTVWLDFLSGIVSFQASSRSAEKLDSITCVGYVVYDDRLWRSDVIQDALKTFLERGANCQISITLHPTGSFESSNLEANTFHGSQGIKGIDTIDTYQWDISLLDERRLRVLPCTRFKAQLAQPSELKQDSLKEFLNSHGRVISLKDWVERFLKPKNLNKMLELIERNLSSAPQETPTDRTSLTFIPCYTYHKKQL
jgi:hypothetical protein